MKRKVSGFLALLLCLTMVVPVLAAENIAGRYVAVSCTREGNEYVCEDEFLQLNEDGTGFVRFNSEDYEIAWKLEGDSFYFIDDEGFELDGIYQEGFIAGNYGSYDYVYQLNDESTGTSQKSPAAAPGGSDTDPVRPTTELDPTADVLYGTFYEGEYQRNYLLLNEDGSGIAVDDGDAFTIRWTRNGSDFSFTDHMGMTMDGTWEGGTITGSYYGVDRVWTYGSVPAPITTFAPERWGKGLDHVTDQADILTDEEEAVLEETASAISETYGCQIYIVALDDMNNYSNSWSIETCAEEIRAGYNLDNGGQGDLILLLMSMADRDYDLMAHGEFGNYAFTDYGRTYTEDNFLYFFKDNDWYGGYREFLGECNLLLEHASKGHPFDRGDNPVTRAIACFCCIALSVIISVVVSLVLKSTMRSAEIQKSAEHYISESGIDITYRHDRYTHTSKTRVYDPPSKSSGGRGGSSSGRSGSSHSSGKF